MSDLVKRLRDCEFMGMPDARLDYSTAAEAADRIEALEARIEELEQALQVTCEREAATTARYDARIQALEARIAKADALAKALQSWQRDNFKFRVSHAIKVGATLAAYRETGT